MDRISRHVGVGKRLGLVATLVVVALLAVAPGPASASPSAPRILIIASDVGAPPTTLRDQILAQPFVAAADIFDAYSATPTVAQLTAYDVVVPMSNNAFSDPVTLGDNLADYQDQGGEVVALDFDWINPPFDLRGRWITGGYSPYQAGAANDFSDATLGAHDASNPLLAGVSALEAFYRLMVSVAPGATQIATWSDGVPAVAFKGHAVGVNAYLGDSPKQWSGDFAKIIVNAAPLPSNAFSVAVAGKTLAVGVSAPGKVDVSDAAAPLSASADKKKRRTYLKPSSASGNPPTISVPLLLTKLAKQKLRQTGKLRLNARISFTPQRGTASTQTAKLKLRSKHK